MAIFLDIEGTIIEEMCNPVFLDDNCTAIRNKILTSEIDSDRIFFFSWAICNEEDERKCRFILEAIKTNLGLKETPKCIFRDDLFPAFKAKFGSGLTHIEFEELCQSLGKELVFQLFIREFAKTDPVGSDFDVMHLLIDDRVSNSMLTFTEDHHAVIATCVNIEEVKLEDWRM